MLLRSEKNRSTSFSVAVSSSCLRSSPGCSPEAAYTSNCLQTHSHLPSDSPVTRDRAHKYLKYQLKRFRHCSAHHKQGRMHNHLQIIQLSYELPIVTKPASSFQCSQKLTTQSRVFSKINFQIIFFSPQVSHTKFCLHFSHFPQPYYTFYCLDNTTRKILHPFVPATADANSL
jgi:hypothetical protein